MYLMIPMEKCPDMFVLLYVEQEQGHWEKRWILEKKKNEVKVWREISI